ncbi:MAG: glycosyltransferase family 4 protein [Vicinamibacterales bacterium]
MRIALFHNLPSGGAKRAVFEWTRRLVERHDVDVFTFETADHAFCDLRPLVASHREYPLRRRRCFESPFGRFNQLQRWRDLVDLDALSRQMGADIDQGGYDVLFAHTCQLTFIPVVLAWCRLRSVYYLHEPFGRAWPAPGGEPTAGPIRRRVDAIDPLIRLYRTKLDRLQRASLERPRLLANSEFTRRQMAEAYDVPSTVCYMGVDTTAFSPRSVERSRHVLSVGELAPRKGFRFLVEALSRIAEGRRPVLRLACNVVQPVERSLVENMARSLGVQIDVRVGLGTEALAAEYGQAAFCVYAPLREPFGLVPLEAMACGTAVIGVAEGGVTESVVHDVTGLLLPRDAGVFAEAIDRLLSDPERAARYGQRGRARVFERWTWDRSVQEIERNLAAAAGMTGFGAAEALLSRMEGEPACPTA